MIDSEFLGTMGKKKCVMYKTMGDAIIIYAFGIVGGLIILVFACIGLYRFGQEIKIWLNAPFLVKGVEVKV